MVKPTAKGHDLRIYLSSVPELIIDDRDLSRTFVAASTLPRSSETERPQTSTVRGAVEQAIPQLREALAEQGIALGEAMVGEHRQGFAGNGDGQPGQQGSAPAGRGLAGEPAATEESVPVSRIIGGDTGGVDLYA